MPSVRSIYILVYTKGKMLTFVKRILRTTHVEHIFNIVLIICLGTHMFNMNILICTTHVKYI